MNTAMDRPPERELTSTAVDIVHRHLPVSWTLQPVPTREPDLSGDLVLRLAAPDGAETELVFSVKRTLDPRDVPALRERLARCGPLGIGVVVARYLTRSVRERLAEAGLSYVDATGNILVRSDVPGLFISDRGADRDPWRGPGRPRGTLKGEPAAKVVRALLDITGPWGVRRLVDVSKTSTGSVYRVIDHLDREGLITRGSGGRIDVPDWTSLLRRWSDDYQFLHTNTVTRWIAPRGLAALLDRVRSTTAALPYALTGSVAASAWAAYAPTRTAMAYVADADEVADTWGLRATEAGANVLLARPAYDVVFERATSALDGLCIAAPTQVAVDLMTGPGRAPAEAEELLVWMRHHESSWR